MVFLDGFDAIFGALEASHQICQVSCHLLLSLHDVGHFCLDSVSALREKFHHLIILFLSLLLGQHHWQLVVV